jgi:bacillithiol synthase
VTVTSEPACASLPLDLYPAMNPLALDLVRGESGISSLFRTTAPAATSEPSRRQDLVPALRKSNAAWGNDVGGELEAWGSGVARAIVAGQQVGFGGGPLYTLAKIASLIHLKRKLERDGTAVAAFFWLATEDHDFDEVATLRLLMDGELRELRSRRHPAARVAVGKLPVPQDLHRAAIDIFGSFDHPWLEPGITFGDSFARLVSSAARGEIILVDSLLPELRRAGAGLFRSIAGEMGAVDEALRARSGELERRGYASQVTPGPDGRYKLFYSLDERFVREPLSDPDRLESLATASPESVSTGALMRPLLQDSVFGPDVFIGGPAEVAYYAQLGRVYDHLGLPLPQVLLRAHVLAAPAKVLRGAARHRIPPEEWLDDAESILLRREGTEVEELKERIARLHTIFDSELAAIRDSILRADPTMSRSMNRTVRRIQWHLDALERRGQRVIARRDRERHHAVERLTETLRPGGVMQDRVAGWVLWWHQWGETLLDAMIPSAEPGRDTLEIIGLQ